MDLPVGGRFASGSKSSLSVATNGTGFLLVWVDGRADWTANVEQHIYAARVDASGTVEDPVGTELGLGVGAPYAAFDGTNYMVVWDNLRARVTTGGVVLDPGGVTFANTASAEAIAFDGTNYLIACSTCGGAIRMSPGGTVLATVTDTSLTSTASANIACDGAGCAVTYWTGPECGAEWISNTTSARWSVSLPTSTFHYTATPAIAFDGTNYGLAWLGTNDEIYLTRVQPGGTVLDASGILVSSASSAGSHAYVAFDGTHYQVGWDEGSGSAKPGRRVARVSPAGTVIDTTPLFVTSYEIDSLANGLACAGSVCLDGWVAAGPLGTNDSLTGGTDLVDAVRVSSSTEAVLGASPILVSTAANTELDPQVAYDGTNYMVVWQDDRSTPPVHTYGARVSPSGVVLDSPAILLPVDADAYPTIGFDGTNYVVAWVGANGSYPQPLRVARVSTAGVLVDSSGITVGSGGGPITLACGPGQCMILFVAQEGDGAAQSYALRAMRVSASASALDPGGFDVFTERTGSSGIAWNGSDYLVVQGGASGGAVAKRVSTAGAVLDSTSIVIAGGPLGIYGATSDGSDFLVGTIGPVTSQAYPIYVSRIRADGINLDPAGIVAASGFTGPAALGFDGVDYQLVFAVTSGTQPTLGPSSLYRTAISTSGVVRTPGGAPLGSPFSVSSVAIAGNGAGMSLVVSSSFDPSAPYGSFRTLGRFVSAGIDGGAEAGVDAGPNDAGAVVDSGAPPIDAGAPIDAAPPSDAAIDSGSGAPSDADVETGAEGGDAQGETDSAVSDGSEPLDAETLDGSSTAQVDASVADAAPPADGGADSAATGDSEDIGDASDVGAGSGGGCSCRTTGVASDGSGAWLGAFASVGAWARRRRRRPDVADARGSR